MSQIKLDSAVIEQTIGTTVQLINAEVLEAVTPLGAMLSNDPDQNRITEELRDNCMAYQESYNSLIESVNLYLKDLGEVLDLSEYQAKKASVGDVKKEDLSFQAGSIDTSAARSL